jgi:uncharacterized membrane protein YeaQ/YmgE (transglycosylase-associated protein family)
MHFIWTLIVGLVVGAVAKFFIPGPAGGGIFITMLLGIAGAMLAGWAGSALGWYAPDEATGFIASVIGAIVILIIYRKVFR